MSVDLLCVAGPDGYFQTVSPSWTALLGYSREELLSRPFTDFVHPDDRDQTAATTLTAAGETIYRFENRYRSKDGAYRWLQWTSRPSDEEGRIYATARDITEHKQLQLLEQVRAGIWAARARHANSRELVERALETTCRLMGWSVGALWFPDGNTLKLRWSWIDAEADRVAFMGAVGSVAVHEGQGPLGQVWATRRGVVVDDLNGTSTVMAPSVFRDAGVIGLVGVPVPTVDGLAVLAFVSRYIRPLEASLVPVLSEIGALLGSSIDEVESAALLDAARHAERHALQLEAETDALTGLPNARAAKRHLDISVSAAAVQQSAVTVAMIDLDRFKEVNDTLGHAAGDGVLRAVAARLRDVMRGTDVLARLGGDEFVLVVENELSPAALRIVAGKLHEAFDFPLAEAGDIRVRPSIGFACFPTHGSTGARLLQAADAAMYAAKVRESRYEVFDPRMPAGRGGSPSE